MNGTWTEVEALIGARATWSDEEILAEFAAIPVLDEASASSEEAFWDQATLYLALTEISAVRKLRPAAKLILEKAEPGDPGSIMRGIRHALERIYEPDWPGLAEVCIEAFHSKFAGAKVWGFQELTVLEVPSARRVFEEVLRGDDDDSKETAAQGLVRLDVLRLKQEHEHWSDEQVLSGIAGCEPIANEDDPVWTTGTYWESGAWHNANLYEALGDIATTRQLKPAIRLLLDKACLGNPRQLMSSSSIQV
jgi:hypothetical protein